MANNEDKKAPVLDLIGGTKKKKASAPQAAAPAKAAPAPAAKKQQAAAPKKEALDLLSPRKQPRKQQPAETAPAAAPAPKAAPAPAPAPKAEPAPAPAPVAEDGGKVMNIKAPISVADLATLMGMKPFKLIAELLPMGVFANPGTTLDSDQVAALCEKHGFTYERVRREKGAGVKAPVEEIKEPEAVAVEEEPEDSLKVRTPIITVMGHVDHGKTSLLDYIRRTKVTAGEAGGITQHIGAYTVQHGDNTLTFIDTPGHAIFTEMRARGADVTDIVVLVVAANDGIMPQTKEAIMHAKAAGKTIIVAVNKCDLPAADPVRVRTQLMENDLMPTDFGGEIECVDVSAHTGAGIEDLLDLLCLQAEVLELKANPKANCRASIIEARME
ncbi:MAG: translation initiation factor IF-2 N-terminal domain-containing protein, partial [Akkermansia sp.]|nr:translation initiation factor IF-2 N-terminal domain-containing protein [Akkermansia sp.]